MSLISLLARAADLTQKAILFLDTTGSGPYAPVHAMIDGNGTLISAGNPFTVTDAANAAFQGAVAMTVGTNYAAQRSVGVLCTVAGNVAVTFSDGSTIALPVYPGWQTFPFAVTKVNSSGTTATATYFNLK